MIPLFDSTLFVGQLSALKLTYSGELSHMCSVTLSMKSLSAKLTCLCTRFICLKNRLFEEALSVASL